MDCIKVNVMNNQEEFLLNVLSIVRVALSPIQIQKLFFLLEKRLGKEAEYFDFQPYFYGPYDKNLTEILNKAVQNNKLELSNINGVSYYQINKSHVKNTDHFLDDKKKQFIDTLVNFITHKSFKELCFAIYKEFPDMKKNSVFNGN